MRKSWNDVSLRAYAAQKGFCNKSELGLKLITLVASTRTSLNIIVKLGKGG